MTRIDDTFARLRAEGRKAFVSYVMAGDPDYDTSLQIVLGLPGAGVDIIELGMPFTDPMADGTTIQLAGQRALNNGQIASNALASSRGKQGNPVLALAFSADDKLVVATTQDPGVSTWEFQIDQNRNALGEQQDRAVDHVATRWRDGIHTQFSADRAGQVEACFGPLIGSTCTRLGRSFGTPITGLAVNDEGTRLIVSGRGNGPEHRKEDWQRNGGKGMGRGK